MDSRAKLAGHPIHQMLIVFPLGLLATAVVFDGVGLFTHRSHWFTSAFWMIAAGILGGLAAAVFGLIDWLAIPRNTRAKRLGAWHGIGNVLVVGLFALAWLMRRDAHDQLPTMAFILQCAAAGLTLFTAWMGGELVDRLGIGVHEGAHVDAPSSLRSKHAQQAGGTRKAEA